MLSSQFGGGGDRKVEIVRGDCIRAQLGKPVTFSGEGKQGQVESSKGKSADWVLRKARGPPRWADTMKPGFGWGGRKSLMSGGKNDNRECNGGGDMMHVLVGGGGRKKKNSGRNAGTSRSE